MSEIKPVYSIRVASISDIARFAALMISLGQPAYIIHFKHEEENYYGMLAIFHDYFNLNGVPIFYYCSAKEEGKYILVKVDEGGELVMFSDRTKAGYISIPVITLYKKPEFIQL
jgi:hypothetical protein